VRRRTKTLFQRGNNRVTDKLFLFIIFRGSRTLFGRNMVACIRFITGMVQKQVILVNT